MKTPEKRKAESIDFLKAKGIDVIDHLPLLESESEMILRPAPDVAKRTICLVFTADFAQGYGGKSYWEYIKKYSLRSWFTRQEWKFLKSKQADEQIKINMSWRIESAYFLLWALGQIQELPFPADPTDPNEVYACLPPFDQSPSNFVNEAKLIKKADILDKADLIYRAHWATRDAILERRSISSVLQEGVVKEWHHAVNWLTCYGNEDWDEVTTDT